jgi:hypothetical protein
MELVNGPTILRWAIACNARARNLPEAEEVAWADEGEDRLRRLAVHVGQQLSLNQLAGEWDNYRGYTVFLACRVAEGPIFREKGPETARDLLLCLLYAAGFRLPASVQGGRLCVTNFLERERAQEDRDRVAREIHTCLTSPQGQALSPGRLSDLIRERFTPPVTPAAGEEPAP